VNNDMRRWGNLGTALSAWAHQLALVLIAAHASMLLSSVQARAQGLDGTWIVSDRVAIEVFNCESAVCGRVVWLRNPALRTREMCGRTIVWGLTPNCSAQWDDGWLFDPEDRETYNLSATLQTDGTISARIYEGFSLFGRTELLRRISPYSLNGWC
jgi:uncharacterized protein (DUF2147 family)